MIFYICALALLSASSISAADCKIDPKVVANEFASKIERSLIEKNIAGIDSLIDGDNFNYTTCKQFKGKTEFMSDLKYFFTKVSYTKFAMVDAQRLGDNMIPVEINIGINSNDDKYYEKAAYLLINIQNAGNGQCHASLAAVGFPCEEKKVSNGWTIPREKVNEFFGKIFG